LYAFPTRGKENTMSRIVSTHNPTANPLAFVSNQKRNPIKEKSKTPQFCSAVMPKTPGEGGTHRV
jgi:hypothetical protein